MISDFPEPGIPSILMIVGRKGELSRGRFPPVLSLIGVRGYSSSSLLNSKGCDAELPIGSLGAT